MKAWIFDGVVLSILPAEADPESMGPIYDISSEDTDTLEEANQLLKAVIQHRNSINDRIVRKLRRNDK